MTKRITAPANAIRIQTYAELQKFVQAFSQGAINLLVLVGPPGVAKSQTVRQSLGDTAHAWIEGQATAFGMYCELYRKRDQLVVVDDVDALYSDRAAVRLLKSLCQTEPVKQVAWHTAAVSQLEQEGLPRNFATRSRLLIIANDFKAANVNVEAVLDRGHHLLFDPTPEEVHRQVAEWFTDEEVFRWFGAHLHLIAKPSMRHYVRAAELKSVGIDWLKVLMGEAFTETTLVVARLRSDPSFANEEARARAFVEQGAGCRATYFNHAKKLRPKRKTKPLDISLRQLATPVARKFRVVGQKAAG